MRRIAVGAGIALLLTSAALGVRVLPRWTEERLVTRLVVCLAGEPLRPGEAGAERVRTLDALVDRSASGHDWPGRCDPFARDLMRSRSLAGRDPALASALEKLDDEMDRESSLQSAATFLEQARPWPWSPDAAARVPPPRLLRPPELREAECSSGPIAWDDRGPLDSARFLRRGWPDVDIGSWCEAQGSPEGPLSLVRCGRPRALEREEERGPPLAARERQALDAEVSARLKDAQEIALDLRVCRMDSSLVVAAGVSSLARLQGSGSKTEKVKLWFVEAGRWRGPLEVPRYGEEKWRSNPWMLGCSGGEAQVAWLEDDPAVRSRPMFVARCGRSCDLRSATLPGLFVAPVFEREVRQLSPQALVPHGGLVTALWIDRGYLRARTGPLESVAGAPEQVLLAIERREPWLREERLSMLPPRSLLSRGEVALLPVGGPGGRPAALRLLRIDALGVRRLVCSEDAALPGADDPAR